MGCRVVWVCQVLSPSDEPATQLERALSGAAIPPPASSLCGSIFSSQWEHTIATRNLRFHSDFVLHSPVFLPPPRAAVLLLFCGRARGVRCCRGVLWAQMTLHSTGPAIRHSCCAFSGDDASLPPPAARTSLPPPAQPSRTLPPRPEHVAALRLFPPPPSLPAASVSPRRRRCCLGRGRAPLRLSRGLVCQVLRSAGLRCASQSVLPTAHARTYAASEIFSCCNAFPALCRIPALCRTVLCRFVALGCCCCLRACARRVAAAFCVGSDDSLDACDGLSQARKLQRVLPSRSRSPARTPRNAHRARHRCPIRLPADFPPMGLLLSCRWVLPMGLLLYCRWVSSAAAAAGVGRALGCRAGSARFSPSDEPSASGVYGAATISHVSSRLCLPPPPLVHALPPSITPPPSMPDLRPSPRPSPYHHPMLSIRLFGCLGHWLCGGWARARRPLPCGYVWSPGISRARRRAATIDAARLW